MQHRHFFKIQIAISSALVLIRSQHKQSSVITLQSLPLGHFFIGLQLHCFWFEVLESWQLPTLVYKTIIWKLKFYNQQLLLSTALYVGFTISSLDPSLPPVLCQVLFSILVGWLLTIYNVSCMKIKVEFLLDFHICLLGYIPEYYLLSDT